MAGWNSVNAGQTIGFSDNFSFDGTERGGGLVTDGTFWAGSAAGNAGFPVNRPVKQCNLTSSDLSLNIVFSDLTNTTSKIDLTVNGGAVTGLSLTTQDTNIVPPTAGNWNISGGTALAGTDPVKTFGVIGTSTVTTTVQLTQAIAGTDATKVGLAAFDSSSFSVDANGFVSLSGTGSGETITGDSGGPLSPTLGNWNIFGGTVVAGTTPMSTSGSGSTLTINAQRTQAIAATDSTKIGLAAFDSAKFTVDANGFVGINGSGIGETITGQSGGPLSPTLGNWNIFAGTVVAGTTPMSTSGAGSTLTVNAQRTQAIAATDATKIGLAAFDSAAFDVDANGFVQLNGGGIASTQFTVQQNTAPGTNPVLPTAAGNVTVNGNVVANHSVVLESRSRAANAFNLEIQYAAAAAATDGTKSGVAHFDSADFTVDASGFVSLSNSGVGQTITGQIGGPLSPVLGNWNVFGGTVSAGTTPVYTTGSGNTLTTEVQVSQAIASTDATKVGLSNFDSARFTVDANGFVSANGSGIGQTITGDSGGALSPTSGNWNILGRSGSKTSGSGSTLTVKSPPYADQGGSTTVTLNSGSFATAAITLTLPASAGLIDGDIVEFICTTSSALVIQSVGTQKIRIGTLLSSAAGTATSSNVGDSLKLRFRATDGFWYATSSVGVWVIA